MIEKDFSHLKEESVSIGIKKYISPIHCAILFAVSLGLQEG
jgi:hypothetical protein